jgi:hypothetical protein
VGEPMDYFNYYNEQTPFFMAHVITGGAGAEGGMERLKNTLRKIAIHKNALFKQSSYYWKNADSFAKYADSMQIEYIRVAPPAPQNNDPSATDLSPLPYIPNEWLFNNELIFMFQLDETGKTPSLNHTVFYSGKEYVKTMDTDAILLSIKNVYGGGEYRVFNAADYTRGWMIGDFAPSIIRTPWFEVGILTHKMGEKHGFHYHKVGCEINLLLKGKMVVNGIVIFATQIFVFEPNQISCPVFLEDCVVLCIKIPSKTDDKYVI